MNNPVFLSGLNKIYSKFDIFFVDLWGVVHNGIECYSDALKALKNTKKSKKIILISNCLLYTSPSPRDGLLSRMPSSA